MMFEPPAGALPTGKTGSAPTELRRSAMSTVDEYHKYARDCLRWAARARTEEQRERFLSLAHDWTQAALGLEGGVRL
jgi:hypothetical protein